jgi:hypothetical protein
MRLRWIVGCVVAATCFAPWPVQAATSVTCATLQGALDTAGADDTIALQAGQVCGDSYTLPDVPLTIEGGAGAGFKPTTNGRSLLGGNGDLTLRNLSFDGHDGDAEYGGGLQFNGLSSLTIEDSDFHDITSPGDGGGAYVQACSATITGTDFTDNSADGNGGGLALVLIGCGRGGVAAAEPGTAELKHDTYTGNEAGLDTQGNARGGGLSVHGNGGVDCAAVCAVQAVPESLEVGHNIFEDNGIVEFGFFHQAFGGGASYDGVSVTATETESYRFNYVVSSDDAFGGGFSVENGAYTGVNDVVLGNSADGIHNGEVGGGAQGGAISLHASQLDLTHATIIHNRLTTWFEPEGDFLTGGIWGDSVSTISVIRSILFDNTHQVVPRPDDEDFSADPGPVIDGPQIAGTEGVVVALSIYCDVDPPVDDNLCETPLFESETTARQLSSSPSVDRVPPTEDNVLVDFEDQIRPVTIVRAATPYDMGADEVQAGGGGSGHPSTNPTPTPGTTPQPTPGTTPEPTPGVTVTPTPTPGGGVKGNVKKGGKKRRCAGRRRFRIVVRNRPGVTWVKAAFTLRGRHIRTRVFHGRLGAIVDLRHISRRTIVLRITAVTSTGLVVHGKRVYHPCRKKRPHSIPELRSLLTQVPG